MSNISNFADYYSKKENKEKLVALIKKNGSYIRLCPTNGYVYNVNVGSVQGINVFLEVGIKSGNIMIINSTSPNSQTLSSAK